MDIENQSESIKEFCSKINEDSEKEISSIIERAEYTAKAKAAEVIADAEKKGQAMSQNAVEESKLVRKHTLSDLNLELKKVDLRMRGGIIDGAVNKLKEKLIEFRSSSEYPEFLIKLAVEGAAALNDDKVTLRFCDGDKKFATDAFLNEVRERSKKLLGREIAFSVDPRAIKGAGGLHVVGGEGRVLFDNTIESRLGRMGDDLKLLISRKIFG